MRLTQAIFRAWVQSREAVSTEDEEQENQGTTKSDIVQASFSDHRQTTGESCAQATRNGNGRATSGKTGQDWSHVLLAWDETEPFKLIDSIASNGTHTCMQISLSTVRQKGRCTVQQIRQLGYNWRLPRGFQSGDTMRASVVDFGLKHSRTKSSMGRHWMYLCTVQILFKMQKGRTHTPHPLPPKKKKAQHNIYEDLLYLVCYSMSRRVTVIRMYICSCKNKIKIRDVIVRKKITYRCFPSRGRREIWRSFIMGISIVSLANRGCRKPSRVPETLVVRAT